MNKTTLSRSELRHLGWTENDARKRGFEVKKPSTITITEVRSLGWSVEKARRYGYAVIYPTSRYCLQCGDVVAHRLSDFCDGSCAMDWMEENGEERKCLY